MFIQVVEKLQGNQKKTAKNHSEKATKEKTLTSYIACHQMWLHLYIDGGMP